MVDPTAPPNDNIPLVLIVDDDRTTRSLLNLAMAEEGYRVVDAKDGKQGLAEYARRQPEMVLLDAVMPEMDGFTCCQQLRQQPGGDRIPILMLTVLDDQESVDQAFAAGATDYITKPIHWPVLSQRVRRLIATNRALTEATMATTQLRQQQAWTALLRTTLERLSHTDPLWDTLQLTVKDLQGVLAVDRVLFYQQETQQGVESANPGLPQVPKPDLTSLGLTTEYGSQYQQGQIVTLENLTQTDLSEETIAQFAFVQTKAVMIAPVLIQQQLWGLLCAHCSQAPHRWESWQLDCMSDLAHLLAIAIDRYERVEQLATLDLEDQDQTNDVG